MLNITHLVYARRFKKAFPVGNLLPSFRRTIATEGGNEWLPARLNSSKAQLMETRRHFGNSGRPIMPQLWQQRCASVISVCWQKRSARERFSWHGVGSHVSRKRNRSVPG